jgi:hypothetical protein
MSPEETSNVAPPDEEEGVWCIDSGEPQRIAKGPAAWRDEASDLTYSNLFNYKLERVFFDVNVFFSTTLG